MHILSLTVDEAGDSAAFPIPRGEVGLWGSDISGTTGMLSEDHRTSPATAPTRPAAQGHLLQHTACTHREISLPALSY